MFLDGVEGEVNNGVVHLQLNGFVYFFGAPRYGILCDSVYSIQVQQLGRH